MIVGPTLVTIAALPFRVSLGLGGVLFCILLVVIAVAVIGGAWPALAEVVLGILAGAFFFARPYESLGVYLQPDLLSLVVFTVVGAVVAILIGELARLAEEQASSRRVEAALRRVATLVARASPAEELFAAVTEEVGRLVAADFARLARYETADALTFVAAWSRTGEHFPVGSRWTLTGENNIGVLVLRTGRPARIDDFAGISGPLAADARERGIRSAAGAPIIVEGRIWGVMFAGSNLKRSLPPDTEARLASVTDLLETAIANADSRAGLTRLAEEQAALRRVATLVAGGAQPEEVFAAVTEEARQLLPVDFAGMGRYGPDGTVLVVTGWSQAGLLFPIGTQLVLGGNNVTTMVARTSRPARLDNFADASGAAGELARGVGFRSSIGTPILVEGRLWGLMIGGSIDHPLPLDTEERLASFTELVAMAIANAEGRAGLTRLAEEQAALRRVATLVARGAPADELFAAVTGEAGQLLHADRTTMSRYESDGTATIVAGWSAAGDAFPVGARPRLGGNNVTTLVWQTCRPARMDSYSDGSGNFTAAIRDAGLRSGVGTPIIVQDRLWGVIIAGSLDERPLAPDTEARLASFTELVATAIANAESRSDLDASRARIVAASDEVRRRIERDLHDGAQQRLVSLGLTLRAAQTAVPLKLGELGGELANVADGLANVVDELREMARGIHPAILAKGGLGPALKTLARRCTVPVELDVRAVARLPERVEVAAYYVVSEALTNAAKHAQASAVNVEVEAVEGALRLCVRDDGAGGADPIRGSGLVGLKDRVEALGGTITIQSPAGAGTALRVELPLNG
jgi:signal transduction histidine kinase